MKLSKKAVAYAEENMIEVDLEELSAFVHDSLVRPRDAEFWDDALYVTHTLAFGTPAWHLTSDYIISQVNYRVALETLEPLGAEAATIGHWTYSQFECIKVPMLTKSGKITPAAVELWNLVEGLKDYPMLSDDLYGVLEMEVNDEAMTQAIEWEERQREIEFDDEQKGMIHQLYWENWYGYDEAGYIEDEKFQEVVEQVLSGEYQSHQEVGLF